MNAGDSSVSSSSILLAQPLQCELHSLPFKALNPTPGLFPFVITELWERDVRGFWKP